MANDTSVFDNKLKELNDKIAAAEAELTQAQDAARADPTPETRGTVQRLKLPLFALTNERAFYLRAISEAQGGTSYTLPA